MPDSNYKVLITTSGTGSRLGELTKNKNKALIEIAGRPAIDYVLDSYAPEIPLVFTVGYLAEQVMDFMRQKHPERQMEFVRINPYEGPGSSLGYSMLCARNNLQRPFIFHACDTIVAESVPPPAENWVGGYVPPSEEFARAGVIYRTHKFKDGKLVKVNDKGATDFESVHIGLTGVRDWELFWSVLAELLKSSDPANTAWSDVHVIEAMLARGAEFRWVPYKIWLDTGNPEALRKTEEYFKNIS